MGVLRKNSVEALTQTETITVTMSISATQPYRFLLKVHIQRKSCPEHVTELQCISHNRVASKEHFITL